VIRVLTWMQLAVSVGVLVLFWLIYPGVMLAVVGAVGLCYVLSALGALRNVRPAIWSAFAFSLATTAFAGYGVYRYVVNGFDFLSASFPFRSGTYFVPYLFVAIAAGALAVVVMHVGAPRWMLTGHR
jgi:hypothetical protein